MKKYQEELTKMQAQGQNSKSSPLHAPMPSA
jgi:hypothetical protein